MTPAEVLSTREIVDRLLATERAKKRPFSGQPRHLQGERRADYIEALEDVIHYDEQHAKNRPRARVAELETALAASEADRVALARALEAATGITVSTAPGGLRTAALIESTEGT